MRPFLILILIVLLASCAAGFRSPDFGLRTAPEALPAVADLPRIASETGEGSTHSPFGQVIAQTDGVTEFTDVPSRLRIQCDGTGGEQWVILGMFGLKPASGALRYTFIEAETIHEFEGCVFTAGADFGLDTWRFQDVSMTGWYEGWPDSHFGGIEIPPDAQPVAPDGGLYFAMIVCGEWAEGSCARNLALVWEYDEPFLAAPVLSPAFEIDAGPDWEAAQCGGLAIYRCYGAWDPEQAEIVKEWDTDWLPDDWHDPDAPPGLRSYGAALINDGWDQPPLSEFSNVLIFGEE